MKKIVALGDSITWGFPYAPSYSWVALLSLQYPKHQFFNLGQNGDTLRGMLFRINEVLSLNPHFCFITGGINDVLMGIPLEQSKEALKKMIFLLKEKNIEVILGIPVDCFFDSQLNQSIKELQAMVKKTAQKENLVLADFTGMLPSCYEDECHPNKKGYQIMVNAAQKALQTFSNFF